MKRDDFVVLMAEDDEHDIVATRRAWRLNNLLNPLYIVNDGEECLDFLFHRGCYADPETSPRPAILLLDVSMPVMDGPTTLQRIRESAEFCKLPVVMLTSSKAEEDRVKCYNLGVNAYIVKPVGFANFAEAIKTIHLFWQLVELPEA